MTVADTRQRPRHRILGIDPGSRTTGFGVIDSDGHHSIRVSSGCIRVAAEPWPERLASIYDRVAALVAAVVAYASIDFFMRFVSRIGLLPFAIYRLVLAAVLLYVLV